jgi:hypothetical protein
VFAAEMRVVTTRSRRCFRGNIGYSRRNLGTLQESWMVRSKEQMMRTVPRSRRMQNTSPRVQSEEKNMRTVPSRDVFDIRALRGTVDIVQPIRLSRSYLHN